MFVDDLITAAPRGYCDQPRVFASSVEAVYLILGKPGDITAPFLPPTMAFDKMKNRPVSPRRISLGIKFDNVLLVVTMEDYKIDQLWILLNATWGVKRKSFTVREAAVLIGNIISCLKVCGCLRWSLHHLLAALTELLKKSESTFEKIW